MLSRNRAGTVNVKQVGTFDLGRLARLHKACFDEGWSRSDLAHLLAMPGGFGVMARHHDGMFPTIEGLRGIGFSLCRVVQDESELLSIGVLPDYRRRKVGQALLQASMKQCFQYGARRLFLEVATDNKEAQALYEAHQFDRVGTRPDYYARPDGSRMNAYTMSCDLAEAFGMRVAQASKVKQSPFS